MYTRCTTCCKNTQLSNSIWWIITHEVWIWIVLFFPRCYKTSFSSGGCFCAFEILVALATKHNLVAVVYTGNLVQSEQHSDVNRLLVVISCLKSPFSVWEYRWLNARLIYPLITQWRYCSIALSHWYVPWTVYTELGESVVIVIPRCLLWVSWDPIICSLWPGQLFYRYHGIKRTGSGMRH